MTGDEVISLPNLALLLVICGIGWVMMRALDALIKWWRRRRN